MVLNLTELFQSVFLQLKSNPVTSILELLIWSWMVHPQSTWKNIEAVQVAFGKIELKLISSADEVADLPGAEMEGIKASTGDWIGFWWIAETKWPSDKLSLSYQLFKSKILMMS